MRNLIKLTLKLSLSSRREVLPLLQPTVTLRSCQSWSPPHQSYTTIRSGFLHRHQILLTIVTDHVTDHMLSQSQIFLLSQSHLVSPDLSSGARTIVCLRELPEFFPSVKYLTEEILRHLWFGICVAYYRFSNLNSCHCAYERSCTVPHEGICTFSNDTAKQSIGSKKFEIMKTLKFER